VGRVIAVLLDRLFVVFVYVYMYYMLVRLSVCLNHIKGTIIIYYNFFVPRRFVPKESLTLALSLTPGYEKIRIRNVWHVTRGRYYRQVTGTSILSTLLHFIG